MTLKEKAHAEATSLMRTLLEVGGNHDRFKNAVASGIIKIARWAVDHSDEVARAIGKREAEISEQCNYEIAMMAANCEAVEREAWKEARRAREEADEDSKTGIKDAYVGFCRLRGQEPNHAAMLALAGGDYQEFFKAIRR